MKLLLMFTGGTIGSAAKGDFIAADANKPNEIAEMCKKHCGLDCEYDILTPYSELSENNTGLTVEKLISAAVQISRCDYDGIICTHGTDTLQYSAAALGYALGNGCKPFCLVSSNYPLEDERANGAVNLKYAIKFIKEKSARGVWVVYKNPGENVKVHRATRLLASQSYSDCFYSAANSEFGFYDDCGQFFANPDFYEASDEMDPLLPCTLSEVCECIERIIPYPGLAYPQIGKHVKYVLHESYHSGTINTKAAAAQAFFEQMKKRNITVYLTGASNGYNYASKRLFADYNIKTLFNRAPIAMYMKLWMATSAKIPLWDIMQKSLGGDLFARI
ncbi:MAG: asparaginase domain-containing protein [Clostridia bacterium]|nr:asparaginase domain-containing protein [Clostridia bacterium]